jgi:hypothetical protein
VSRIAFYNMNMGILMIFQYILCILIEYNMYMAYPWCIKVNSTSHSISKCVLGVSRLFVIVLELYHSII